MGAVVDSLTSSVLWDLTSRTGLWGVEATHERGWAFWVFIEWNLLLALRGPRSSFLLPGRVRHSRQSSVCCPRSRGCHTILELLSKHIPHQLPSDSTRIGDSFILLQVFRTSTLCSSTSSTSVSSLYLLLGSLSPSSRTSFQFQFPSLQLRPLFQDPLGLSPESPDFQQSLFTSALSPFTLYPPSLLSYHSQRNPSPSLSSLRTLTEWHSHSMNHHNHYSFTLLHSLSLLPLYTPLSLSCEHQHSASTPSLYERGLYQRESSSLKGALVFQLTLYTRVTWISSLTSEILRVSRIKGRPMNEGMKECVLHWKTGDLLPLHVSQPL